MKNPLKQVEKPVIGIWNTLGHPLCTEVFAKSGFDIQIIDWEHGPMGLERLPDMVNACEKHSCTPIVRVPANSEWMILQALDLGAKGVLVPHVENKADAERALSFAKYYPRGKRGYSPFTKSGGFEASQNHATDTNKMTSFGIIVESKVGLQNLDEILEITDLDFVYFGAYDLSQDFGCPGRTRDPKLIQEISEAAAKVQSKKKLAGGFVAKSWEDIVWLRSININLITYEVDTSLIFKSAKGVTHRFQTEMVK